MNLNPIVTEITLDPFPRDWANGHHWRIQIRRDRDGLWTVHNAGFWLRSDSSWHSDQQEAVRFAGQADAVDTAQEALKTVEVGGVTWDEMCAKWRTP